jgi:predicted RNase H-like HicB family nuclease
MQRYAIVIERAKSNYAAYIPDLPGCIATGPTVEETKHLLQEAIELHVQKMREDGISVPEASAVVDYVEIPTKRLNADEVVRVIADDVKAHPCFFNPHGIELETCLVPPCKLRFIDSFREGQFLDLWMVLEECPGSDTGYLVVFDDLRQHFGLAVRGGGVPVFIGFYGSFTETLSGM